MMIIILSILFKMIGIDIVEKALYRAKLLNNKEKEKDNTEEKLRKQAEFLIKKKKK